MNGSMNGKTVAEGRIEKTQPLSFSWISGKSSSFFCSNAYDSAIVILRDLLLLAKHQRTQEKYEQRIRRDCKQSPGSDRALSGKIYGSIFTQVHFYLVFSAAIDWYEERNIYFWARNAKSSHAEVGYLVTSGSTVYPVEVKAPGKK